jgi:two-component system CheB/CheR fusion protein
VDSLATVEREVQDREGRWYSLRIRPYRTHENKIDGAVILLVDINEHKRALELVMSVVQEPMLSLDADLRVKKASEAYCGMFQVTAPEIEGQYLYDLENGQWNIPKLRTLLGDLMTRQQRVDDFEIEAEFPRIGRRKLSLAARSYGDDGKGTKLILLAIKNINILP